MNNDQKRKLMESLMKELEILMLKQKVLKDIKIDKARIHELTIQISKLADEIVNGAE